MRKYGWHRDLPDDRDHIFALGAEHIGTPDKVDMRPDFPAPYDQGQIGSCTGNACAAALAYARAQQGLPVLVPSRLMLYYSARVLEGTAGQDAGAQIRDVIKGAALTGACPEDAWPYDVECFATKPNDVAYAAAVKDRLIGYHRVPQDEEHVLACLAQGDPVVFGFSVYTAFEGDDVAQHGILSLPAQGEAFVGGHAVVAVGYNKPDQQIIVRNSWGTDWGIGGYFMMPFDYLFNQNLAADLWAVRLVTP
jgi:C1A family cysteine protease